MAKVFISYASSDIKRAAQMHEWLSSKSFESFWDCHADDGIQPGSDWERALYRQISQSHAILLILTPAWLKSKWCFFECAYARALGKPIFPVIVSPTEKLVFASDIQRLDLTHNREQGLLRLEKALRDIAEFESGGFDWNVNRSPFPGLSSFEEADAAVFFGRENEIRSISERVRLEGTLGGSGFIVLLGASGVGKSSLLRAGVLPRLRLDRKRWIVLPPFRPGAAALEELAGRLSEQAGPTPQTNPITDQWANGPRPELLVDLAAAIRAQAGELNAKIIISIDQLEELYTLTDEAQRKKFVDIVKAALLTQAFVVLATLRSDHLTEFQASSFGDTHEIVVKPLNINSVRGVIAGPARLAAISIDEQVIDAAIFDAETGDALPLLAFTLRELFEGMDKKSKMIKLVDYDRLGDPVGGLNPIQNAVRKVADQAIDSIKPTAEELTALRNCLLLHLTTSTDDGRTLRRAAEWLKIPAQARRLIERLAFARVLTIVDKAGSKYVEITHEALLRHWSLAKVWLEEDREFLSWRRRLADERLAWDAAADEEKMGALLSGVRLTQASYWLERKRDVLEEEDVLFIQVSEAVESLQTRSRSRERTFTRLSAAIAGVCILSSIFVWYLAIH